MDRETIRNMTVDQYTKYLEMNIEEQIHFVVNPYKGHAIDYHCGMSDGKMAERLLKEGKETVSTFQSEEKMNECLRDGIFYCSEDIANWMMKNRYEFKTSSEYLNFKETVKIDIDPIGTGITSEFKEKESSYMTFILCRNLEDDSPFGFFLKTAYVDISEGKGEYTGKEWDKNDIYLKTDLHYENAIDKLCDIARREYPQYDIRKCNNKFGETELKITQKIDKDDMYITYLGKNDTKIKHLVMNKTEKITYAKCLQENQDYALAILNIENYRNEIISNKIEHNFSREQSI